jgi:hypothetical protein
MSNVTRASCQQEPQHGCQGSGRRAAGLRPVVDGGAPARVCAAAACHRPRGRRHVTPVGTQCSRMLAMDRRSLACSGVHARQYDGEAYVVCGSSGLQRQFDLPLLHSNFLQFSK